MVKYRTFDGKRYKWQQRFKKRSDADAKAKQLRKNYQLARVVPEKLHGKQWYSVYSRQRVQRRKK